MISETDTQTPGFVQTVLGPIAADQLGVTLPHEHFYCNSTGPNFAPPQAADDAELAASPITLEMRGWLEYNWQSNHDNLTLDDDATAIAEARHYKAAGGDAVIDVTPIGIGRNPQGLAAIARATGLHIVMGSAYYVGAAHPERVQTMTEDEIASEIVNEFAHGVGDTGIRPGVIGEVGCSWPLLDDERKVLQGAASAQQDLGAALYVHPGRHPDAPFEIMEILRRTGVDTTRVIICHIERTVQNLDALKELLSSGCLVEYDIFGIETTGSYFRNLGITVPSDSQRILQIKALNEAGYADRILISHDICFKHRLRKYGGSGYDHILRNVIPLMHANGFAPEDVSRLTTENPRRAISLSTPQPATGTHGNEQ